MKLKYLVAAGMIVGIGICGGRQVSAADLEYVPGEVVVVYDETVSQNQIQSLAEDQDSVVTRTIQVTEDTQAAVVEVPEGSDVESAAAVYEEAEDVLYAQPNYILELYEDELVPEDGYSGAWWLSNIKAYEAWGLLNKYAHEPVTAAVLDTGADIAHEDLKNVVNISLSGEVLKDDANQYSIGPLYGDGYAEGSNPGTFVTHGTHVTGILGAQADNQTGIAGVGSGGDNSALNLMVVDVFSGAKTDFVHVIEGMNYAAECGAKVINMSLGTNMKNESQYRLLKQACDSLYNQGITIVCAAGNEGIKDTGTITTVPCDFESTIGVINSTQSNQKAGGSNYGSLKTLSAPGTGIYSCYNGNTYGMLSGTSMAAPMVTGVVAMMYSLNDSLSPNQVKSILTSTAADTYGIGFDEYSGAGVLDASAALAAVEELKNHVTLPFEDVVEDAWYYNDVAAAYQRGFMTGMDSEHFGPGITLSRAQFVTILYRLEGEPEENYQDIFADVPQGWFFTEPVMWARNNGIISGYDNGLFGTSDPITREQMILILYHYAGYKGYDVSSQAELITYEDGSKVSTFAQEAMEWGVSMQIIRGKNDGTVIDPQGNTVRSECASIMERFLELYID